jgi:hypothetical protein
VLSAAAAAVPEPIVFIFMILGKQNVCV